jgi:hypothetical protein
MTDRVKALTVVLDNDYREDDVQEIAKAIGMVKGVTAVSLVKTDTNDYVNRARVRAELTGKLLDLLRGE